MNEQNEHSESLRKKEEHTRRAFLMKVAVAANAVVGAILAVPILGYVLGPVFKKNSSSNAWVSLGSLQQFPEGETRLVDFVAPNANPWDGQTSKTPCWVRRISDKEFQVFAINCAHLGCPVRWFAQSKLFLCPCHGGAYYQDGSRAAGPPERGLFQYKHKLVRGSLMIYAGELPTLSTGAGFASVAKEGCTSCKA
ncbi:MAG: QcrA and Rieske domain-containing protein [Acidobacteriaceae bacterium]